MVAPQVTESTESAQQEASGVPVSSGGAVSGDSGSLETMSVVESLVKLGEKQPTEAENGSTEETPEVFIAFTFTISPLTWEPLRLGIPTWILIQYQCYQDLSINCCLITQVGPDMPSLDGDGTEDKTEVKIWPCDYFHACMHIYYIILYICNK